MDFFEKNVGPEMFSSLRICNRSIFMSRNVACKCEGTKMHTKGFVDKNPRDNGGF